MRGLGFGLLAIVGLIGALLLFLHTDSGQALIKKRVVAALSERVNGTVEVQRLELRLFGKIALGGVSIKDAAGQEAIGLDSLVVEPNWRELVSGSLVVDRIELSGLTVNLEQYADGTSNLKKLFKPKPATPPSAPSKKARRRIVVRAIELSKIALHLKKADGSELHVTDVGLSASVDAVPDDKTVSLSVPKIHANLTRSTASGTVISVDDISLGLAAELENGAGKIDLLPLTATARLVRPDKKPYETPIALGAVSVVVEPGKLGATLDKLALSLLLLEKLELKGGFEEGALAGDQNAVVLGLHVKGDEVDALLGKDLVATDADLTLKIHGPPLHLDLDLGVKTDGATIALTGTVDASRIDQPKYDLVLTTTKLATRKLLAGETAPDVKSEKIELSVKGTGIKKEKIAADVKLDIGPTSIGKVAVDSVSLRGRLENGVLQIHELTIDALDQKIAADGSFVIAEKKLDAKVRLSGDVGKALGRLRAAGVLLKTNLPPGAVRLATGEVEVEISGKLDEGLSVTIPSSKLHVAGGTATIDATLALRPGEPDSDGKRKLSLDTVSADVKLSHVRLSSLASIRGKKLDGFDGAIDGHVQVRGTKAAPRLDAHLVVNAKPKDSRDSMRATLVAKGDKHTLDIDIDVQKNGRETLASVKAHLPIDASRKGLSPGRELSVKVNVPRQRVSDLRELLPPAVREKLSKVPKTTEVEVDVDLGGSSSHPEGTFHVVGETALMAPIFSTKQRVDLGGKITSDGSGSHLTTELGVWLDTRKPKAATANLDANFRRSPLIPGGAKELDWKLVLDLPRQRIEELPLPPRGLTGGFAAHIALTGNRSDVNGTVLVNLDDVHRDDLGPLAANVLVTLDHTETRLAAKVSAAKLEALRVNGKIGVAGDGLILRAKNKQLGDPSLEINVDLPRHRLDRWAVLRPKLAELEGSFGGKILVEGSAKEPLANGELTLDDFDMLDKKRGRAAVTLLVDAKSLGASVSVGHAGEQPKLRVNVTGDRTALVGLLRSKEGDAQAELLLSIRGDSELGAVVPKIKKKFPDIRAKGDLDWNMDGKVALASHDGIRALADAWIEGKLTLAHGEVPIPQSSRVYKNIELDVSASKDALSINQLSARESDREKKSRSLDLHAKVGWEKLRPQSIALDLQTKDWLLFGSQTLGKPDAPRATLSAKIDVTGTLSETSRKVEVVVASLDLRMPDRFDKAHWPEEISLGDIVYLDEPSAAVGKLPQPERTPPPPPPNPSAIDTEIAVRIPHRIHIQKPPFDMQATGSLDVKISGGERHVSGEVQVHDGAMELGGNTLAVSKKHKSRILFDAEHPKGELDLWVEKPPNPVVLANVSQVSAGGDEVRIHLTGAIAKPTSTVTGVGNADLWDILPVFNAGRVKFASDPDRPPSSTPQLPREYDVVLLSYMAVNLPHNLFLSRMNAWSDEYDDRFAYGKIRHMHADRYSKSGKTRIRATERPPTMGQSNAELEADYLLLNRPRTKAGVGVVGGSRAGGGPALFFEWASDD